MPGRARGNQVRLRPKTTRPTKSGYGDWSHHRLRCGISRCAARAGLSSRSSSYTSWHEGRRVLRSGGLAVFANTNGTFATIGNRFSFTRARRSREKRGVLSARQDVPPAPAAKNLHSASGGRGFESRLLQRSVRLSPRAAVEG